jgi:hypothetical protein
MNDYLGKLVFYDDCGTRWKPGIVVEQTDQYYWRIKWLNKTQDSIWDFSTVKDGYVSHYSRKLRLR